MIVNAAPRDRLDVGGRAVKLSLAGSSRRWENSSWLILVVGRGP